MSMPSIDRDMDPIWEGNPSHCSIRHRVIRWGLPSLITRRPRPELSKQNGSTTRLSWGMQTCSRCLKLRRTTSRKDMALVSVRRSWGTRSSLGSIRYLVSWRQARGRTAGSPNRTRTPTWSTVNFTLLHLLRWTQLRRRARYLLSTPIPTIFNICMGDQDSRPIRSLSRTHLAEVSSGRESNLWHKLRQRNN